ncbi:hypothetical protein CHS0354_001475 [Potamilus streckersoni]|uniref:Etoposide-induced protein 2.4 homolog n=1 Tax=Potamilus streckersoni TaxID=2493646 RepID=A0AAE0T899_9BIVA|nr:hypothetical protein CHS0354_001475 [Potamilus streckersoni]
MYNTFQHICNGIINGFRDNILGALKVYKMDAEIEPEPIKKPEEEMTVLARRRAEKKLFKKKLEPKESLYNHMIRSHTGNPNGRAIFQLLKLFSPFFKAPRISQRIFLCCAWNGGLFWMSIFLFYNVLLPILQWITSLISGQSNSMLLWGWIGPVLSWVFSTLWLLPLFVLSKIVNNLWFQDIADAAYRKSRGKPLLPNISIFIADMVFSLVVQSLFLIQGMLLKFLPISPVGQSISVLHMCLLYSLYSFEYKWINMGLGIHQRVSKIEMNWPYFCGFGLPLAILTSLPSSFVVSGCVFSILFPLSIISANEANENNYRSEIFKLKMFGPVIYISDAFFYYSFKDQGSPRYARTDALFQQSQTSETLTRKR